MKDKVKKKSMDALQESEMKFRTLFESVSDAIFLLDLKGNFIDVNRTGHERLGYTKEEMLSMHIGELDPPEFAKKVPERFAQIKKHGKAVFESAHKRKDGTVMPVEVNARIVDFGGEKLALSVIRDITERKHTEEILQRSEARFRGAFENAAVGASMVDLKGRFLRANQKLCEMLGYSEEELQSRTFSDVTHPDDVQIGLENLKRQLAGEADYTSFEKRYIHKDGHVINVNVSPALIRDDEGNPQYFVGMWQDITERKKAEDSLKAVHEELEERVNERTRQLSLLQSINTAMNMGMSLKDVMQIAVDGVRDSFGYVACDIFLLDEEGKNLILSAISIESSILKKIEKLIGFSSVGFKIPLFEGSHFTEVVMKKKFCIMSDMKRVFGDFTDDKKLKRFAGSVAKIAGFKSTMEVPLIVENEVIGAIGVSSKGGITKNDAEIVQRFASQIAMTIRKGQLEEELRDSEERYRGLVESARDVIFTISLDGTIISLNMAFEEITGFKRSEWIGKSFLPLVHPDDIQIATSKFEQSIEGKKSPTYEMRIRTSSGGYIVGEVKSTPHIKDGKVINVLGIVRDITERKQAEEEMKRRLMKFSLEDGTLYMVKEPGADLSLRAFNDLLGVGYNGLIISRDPKEKFEKTTSSDFEFLWLTDGGGKFAATLKLREIKHRIENLPKKTAVLIDRLDYLIFKKGFEKTLSFVQHLRELAYLSGTIVILSIDPSTQNKRELRLLEKEALEIELLIKARLPEDLLEILSFVYEQNASGMKPSYTSIGKEVAASKPTVRKRIKRLISSGHMSESKKGLYRVVELTDKGRNLFFS